MRATLAKKNSRVTFPKSITREKMEFSTARIVWRSFFFVLVSHAATKKTDCTNAGAMLLIAAMVGLQREDFQVKCSPVCGSVLGSVSL